jgi:hypothetical protein
MCRVNKQAGYKARDFPVSLTLLLLSLSVQAPKGWRRAACSHEAPWGARGRGDKCSLIRRAYQEGRVAEPLRAHG